MFEYLSCVLIIFIGNFVKINFMQNFERFNFGTCVFRFKVHAGAVNLKCNMHIHHTCI